MPPRSRKPTASVVERSPTHLVLIPSYNPGPKVYETVRGALTQWNPVWVVVDGSADGTPEGLQRLAEEEKALRVIVLPQNHTHPKTRREPIPSRRSIARAIGLSPRQS